MFYVPLLSPPSTESSSDPRAALHPPPPAQTKKPKGTNQPIVSDHFGHTYNLDLADMTSEPDVITFPGETFKWFAVLSDHLTGLLLAAVPLRNKASSEVAFMILPAFGSFGAPLILVHDNGSEFKGKFAEDINHFWSHSKVRAQKRARAVAGRCAANERRGRRRCRASARRRRRDADVVAHAAPHARR